MSETHLYPKGTAITFTGGAYSDFRIEGQVVTVEDLDLKMRVKEYLAMKEKGNLDDWEGFATWLIVVGLALPLKVEEVHIGNYSTFDRELLS